MAIDPNNPKKSKNVLPKPRESRSTKAALDYNDLVEMRELLLQELIDDLGGSVPVTPDLLTMVEIRLKNVIAAGLDHKDIANYLR